MLLLFQNLDKSTLITATNGKTYNALKVFAMALRYLKKHLIEFVSQQMEGYVYMCFWFKLVNYIMPFTCDKTPFID